MARYGAAAQKSVESAMHRRRRELHARTHCLRSIVDERTDVRGRLPRLSYRLSHQP